MARQMKITQMRSIIDQIEPQKRTIKALGLGRPNYSVVKKDTPADPRDDHGKCVHLVHVEEVK